MGSGPTTTTNQSQQSVSQPWAPAQPQLLGLLQSLGQQNTGVTGDQSSALASLQNAAGSIPNFAPQASGVAGTLLGGGANNSGVLQNAYGTLQGNLSGLANPANLNPMSTPGFGDALSTVNNDITNQVNGQFAAAGRDLSPANSTALARGLSQGEGSLIANQYNQNAANLQSANNALYSGAGSLFGGLNAAQQQQFANMLSGVGVAGQIPGLAMAPAQAQYGAANAAQQQPFQNLGGLESLLTPLAQLGGTTNSTGTATQQTSVPWYDSLIGGGLSLAGLGTGGGKTLGGSLLGRLGL